MALLLLLLLIKVIKVVPAPIQHQPWEQKRNCDGKNKLAGPLFRFFRGIPTVYTEDWCSGPSLSTQVCAYVHILQVVVWCRTRIRKIRFFGARAFDDSPHCHYGRQTRTIITPLLFLLLFLLYYRNQNEVSKSRGSQITTNWLSTGSGSIMGLQIGESGALLLQL